ncbi:hypothetical protein CTI12_AA353860 [Artemisia annua]|uniref:Helitron helicase-like domain-containing protein n=1 Tax=Artemisia annua TaxID=35608 RepID=A0A2U1MPY3_ARTAN|nr:hypothetical protein CTI12_AA353860 [Artemisia annua]
MRSKTKAVPNRTANEIPIEVSQYLGSPAPHSYQVSGSGATHHSGTIDVVHHATVPLSCPFIPPTVGGGLDRPTVFCDGASASSSTNEPAMEDGATASGYGMLHSSGNDQFDNQHLLVTTPPYQINAPAGIPAQAWTVDGSVSNFQAANIMLPSYVTAQRRPTNEGATNVWNAARIPMVIDFSSGNIAFQPNSVACNTRISARQRRILARLRRHTGADRPLPNRQRTPTGTLHTMLYLKYSSFPIFLEFISYPSMFLALFVYLYVPEGTASMRDTDGPQVQGPIAPPQRQGAPLEYRSFGRCDQVCQHCGAFFWLEEKKTGLPVSAAPQYQRCCVSGRAVLLTHEHYPPYIVHHQRQALRESVVQGLIGFLNENNALVKLFRTARDKLQEADIPNFSIRLFGVVWANQYELPTADSIGAIVFEGGPETMTDYDVVIQRHSGEPESVNKLHPAYMALQFPLLFIYGEEGYHLKLMLRNLDGDNQDEQKKMSMKVYYARMALTVNASTSSKTAESTVVPSRQFAYLTELDPTDNSKFIQVKVYRKWTTAKMPAFTPTAFSCMLLDKKGFAIQANADLKEKTRFDHDLQINCVYKIQDSYKYSYNQLNIGVPQLEVQTDKFTNWEEERNRNRVPLATLLQIDPKTQQRVLFTQTAMILQVDVTHDWYYQKCDECGGKLTYGYLHGQCHQYGTKPNPQNRIVITDGTANALMSCFTPQTDGLIKDVNTLLQEVENKDPSTIPPAILALQNTRHVFQFQFATPALKGPPTFVLRKIMDSPPATLTEPSAGPSSPPTNLPENLPNEESTPPPATPTVTQDTPIDTPSETQQLVYSAARRELFVPTTEEGDTPAPKKQKKD